jgi:alpha-galactosidase
MNITLENPSLQFSLNPDQATWSLFSRGDDGAYLEDVWMSVHYRCLSSLASVLGGGRFRALQRWPNLQVRGPEEVLSPHGPLRQYVLEFGPDQNGLRYTLIFAMPDHESIFLWRLGIDNQGKRTVNLDRVELLRAGFFPKRKVLPDPGTITLRYNPPPSGHGVIRPHPDPGEMAFLANGWQSWSHTAVYGEADRFHRSRMGFLRVPMCYNLDTPRPRKRRHFAGDMFGVLGDRTHRTGILAGFLSQKQHFGSLEAWCDRLYPALRLWANGDGARLEPGGSILTDWAVLYFLQLDSPDPLGPYLDAVAREHDIDPGKFATQNSQTGWCSWYHFYSKVAEDDIRRNLGVAAGLRPAVPLDIIQIDDGFEAAFGDWLEFSPRFPQGVSGLSEEIKAQDFTPGLWFAPFIARAGSRLAREHPDWLLRNNFGRPILAGFEWSGFYRALDLTCPEALDYACQVVDTAVYQWGYPYLKLDFLYAAALKGRYRDPTRTRAQVLRAGLEAIRQAAGDETTLLGCGCPLGSAIGLVDAMRIGTDVDPNWTFSFKGLEAPFRSEVDVPSARNALQNVMTRAALHRRWWVNDPDCLLLSQDTHLTLAEVRSYATAIALSGGSLFCSDDMASLPRERLEIAAKMVPLIGRAPRVPDWFDSSRPRLLRVDLENSTGRWHLLAIFNWEDEARSVDLPLDAFQLDPQVEYYGRCFWVAESMHVADGRLVLGEIPAHGVRLLSLRALAPGVLQYLGSDLHISQGLEVVEWEATPSSVQFRVERPGGILGEIELSLPRPPREVLLNQNSVAYQKTAQGSYRIPVQSDQTAELKISLTPYRLSR